MSKTAALFSGQGSQYPGMGKEFFDAFLYVRDIYACGGDILGYDLAKISFTGSDEQLAQTIYAQPAIFALSLAGFTVASRELGFSPYCVAGHSLGEYAALYCAGAFGLEDGFRIIKARAEAMTEAGDSDAAMYAVMGSDEDGIRAACEEAGGYVIPANFNHPGQTVISGNAEPCAKAAEALAAKGAKIVRLSVSRAFHTELLREAAQRFQSDISNIKFSPLKLVFYSNLTGGKLQIDDYSDYLANHTVSPVRFSEQIQSMAADGVDTCVDFGPKRTAATMAKKNTKALTVFGVEDMASLKKLKDALEVQA